MHQVIIAKCCICGKIRKGTEWIEGTEIIPANKVLFSHTYCPVCLEAVLKELENDTIPTTTLVMPSFNAEEERLYAIVE